MIKKLIKIATKAEVTGQFFMMYLNERKQTWLLYAIVYEFVKITIFVILSFRQEEKYHALKTTLWCPKQLFFVSSFPVMTTQRKGA